MKAYCRSLAVGRFLSLSLLGLSFGCALKGPIHLYDGPPRPANEVALLSWPPGLGYVASVDGKRTCRVSYYTDDCDTVIVLPGKHDLVLACGARHPFLSGLSDFWRIAIIKDSVELKAGRHYGIEFNINPTADVLRLGHPALPGYQIGTEIRALVEKNPGGRRVHPELWDP